MSAPPPSVQRDELLLHVGQLSPEAIRRMSRSSDTPRVVQVSPEQVPVGCPPGLEYLAPLDCVVLKHQNAFLPDALKHRRAGSFYIFTNKGEQLYYANTNNACMCGCNCCAWCMRHMLSIDIHLNDATGREVLLLERPFSWSSPWLPCVPLPLNCMALQQLNIMSTITGRTLGRVSQNYSLFGSSFTASDVTGSSSVAFKATGQPGLSLFGCIPWSAPVLDIRRLGEIAGSESIGRISTSNERLDDTLAASQEHFVLEFPANLAVTHKAALMGALILIDHAYRSIKLTASGLDTPSEEDMAMEER